MPCGEISLYRMVLKCKDQWPSRARVYVPSLAGTAAVCLAVHLIDCVLNAPHMTPLMFLSYLKVICLHRSNTRCALQSRVTAKPIAN